MSSAADGKDGNGLHLEKLRLNRQVISACLQKIANINGHGLFSLYELRLHVPLDGQNNVVSYVAYH